MSVGPGWKPIADRVVGEIVAAGGEIRQVKEKFGGLRVYFSSPHEVYVKLEALVREAEREASRTCEECGSPGEIRMDRPWLKTLCGGCHEAETTG